MRQGVYKFSSELHKTVLVELIESYADVTHSHLETEVDSLKLDNPNFDEALQNTLEARRSFLGMQRFAKSLKAATPAEEVYLTTEQFGYCEVALDFGVSQLSDATTEAFFEETYRNGCDAIRMECLRERVGMAISRLEACRDMREDFKAWLR